MLQLTIVVSGCYKKKKSVIQHDDLLHFLTASEEATQRCHEKMKKQMIASFEDLKCITGKALESYLNIFVLWTDRNISCLAVLICVFVYFYSCSDILRHMQCPRLF